MSSVVRKCFLQCLKTKTRVSLPDKVLTTIGRSEETGISDVFLSKLQLECLADCNNGTVNIKPVGKCVSGCNGYALMAGKSYKLTHGDRIELRLGFHEFDIMFDPPPTVESVNEDAPKPKKAELDQSVFEIFRPRSRAVRQSIEEASQGNWLDIDGKQLLIFTPQGCESRNKIAGFDMDGTIITPKSRSRFPKDIDDWMLLYADIPTKLRELHQDNYKLVFFTNQKQLNNDSGKIREFKRKIEHVLRSIDLPIQVYISTADSIYRKPLPGMWTALCKRENDDIEINLSDSFYVGDAAGRPKNWAPKRNRDHSVSDRLFAINIGLPFYTPEEYFLKHSAAPYLMPDFDPRELTITPYPDSSYPKQNVIIMVGGPGSGKSHFCKTELLPKGYTHINRDTLGSWQKCAKQLELSLSKQENVVVDNTNPDRKSRERYVEVARRNHVDCRCFIMDTNIKHSKHNNVYRQLIDKTHAIVTDAVINTFKKNFQQPEMSEGFAQIVHVPFVPQFQNSEHEKLYNMFLTDQ